MVHNGPWACVRSEWNGLEWNGLEWNHGVEWSGVDLSGVCMMMECNAVEWNAMDAFWSFLVILIFLVILGENLVVFFKKNYNPLKSTPLNSTP